MRRIISGSLGFLHHSSLSFPAADETENVLLIFMPFGKALLHIFSDKFAVGKERYSKTVL